MPAFEYTAIDGSGKSVSGSLAVRNKAEAYRALEAKALSPVKVRETAGEGAAAGGKAAKKARADAAISGPVILKRPLVILFTEELADMLDAGLQLEQALRVLHERQQNKQLKAVAGTLRDDIREGARFSAALKKASPSFDDLYRNLVAAGEASGSLGDILRRLAESLKQMNDLQSRVISAMIYPAFLLLGCICLLFVASVKLLPQLMALITKTGQDLPLITELLMKFSDFMREWWLLILCILIAIPIIFKIVISTQNGRAWWDRWRLVAPAFGPVIAGRFYAQFCHTMSNLVNNGVPLLNALKLMTRGTTNGFLKKSLEQTVSFVGEGGSLAKAMSRTEVFPISMVDRIAIGEQSGDLGKAFAKAARKFDEDLDIRIKRLVGILPVVLLIVMAIVVGMVAYAMITTIFSSMTGISGR
jgi:type II secretory pathway component PulF